MAKAKSDKIEVSGNAAGRRAAPRANPTRRRAPSKLPLAPGVKYRRILLKLSGEALMGSAPVRHRFSHARARSPTS